MQGMEIINPPPYPLGGGEMMICRLHSHPYLYIYFTLIPSYLVTVKKILAMTASTLPLTPSGGGGCCHGVYISIPTFFLLYNSAFTRTFRNTSYFLTKSFLILFLILLFFNTYSTFATSSLVCVL